MKTAFYLAGKALCLRIAYNGQRVRFGMGISTNAANFDAAKQAFRKTEPAHPELNRLLQRAVNFVNEFYHNYLNTNGNTPPPPDVFVNAFNTRFLNKQVAAEKPADTPPELFEFIERYIATRTDVSYPTKRKFANTLKYLKLYFEKQVVKPVFDAVTLDVCLNFELFLTQPPYNLNPNSSGNYIKTLKHFLSKAKVKGYFAGYETIRDNVKAKKNATDCIYLTETELAAILELDLTNKPYLLNARNLFILGSYTGLRYCDFKEIAPANIRGGFIYKTQNKTKEQVKIPLHPIVTGILDANNGTPPRPISNQKLNVYIKELGKLAGIDTPTTTAKSTANGLVKNTTRPKYELITCHTARRSFATNTYLAGLPIDVISSILGHSTITQTETYLKVKQSEKAELAAKHAFFNPAQMRVAK
ncbi:hypothetical protein C7N43_18040 [Sphingobacteriales bacterium UPWRP_1]|nr:hypothetical protein C7N43_18040 [Sphingobacteriales bacterium UPWRP_1]